MSKIIKLTEMQSFALKFLAENDEEINPSYLASQWHLHKHGQYPRAASRDSWGTTTAGYKTLRKLAELGLANKHISKTSGGYTNETYTFKKWNT